MKYKAIYPPTRDQGSYSTVCSNGYFETYRKNALADYNSARDHDGFPPLSRNPKGTKFVRIKD